MSMGRLVLRSSAGEAPAGFCASSSFVDYAGNHYPDETCTGYEPTGVSLTAYSGPTTITANGTTIDSKHITSTLTIEATGVTISRSWIDISNGTAVYIDDAGEYAEANNGADFLVTISDTTISCGNATNTQTGIWESYAYLLRVHMTHCENALSVNQKITVEDSYLHDYSRSGEEAHEDQVQLSNGHWNGSAYGPPDAAKNFTVKRSTLIGMSGGDTVFGTSAIISNGQEASPPSSRADEDILIDNNWMAGGGYTLYCNPVSSSSEYVVTNNRFSNQFDVNVGSTGPTTNCGSVTFTGNVCAETGAAMTSSTTTC